MDVFNQDKIHQETQAADQIRSEQARKQWEQGNSARSAMHGKAWEGIMSAMDDIYRRVIEQAWFGKDVNDVLHHIHNRPDPADPKSLDQERNDKNPDRTAEPPAGPEHDYSPDRFYGRDLGR